MAESEPVVATTAASAIRAHLSDPAKPYARLIGLLAIGHLVVDLNQGSLPAILPFLKTAHNLSYAAAATIVLVANVTSSVIQPLFGYLADRTAHRWMLPLAVALSGVGLGLTGVAPGYAGVLALVVVMGFGVAAYHPEGYRTATSLAGEHRKATALSWFSLGGNIGIALGPPVITMLVATEGLHGSLGIVLPSLVVTAMLLGVLPRISDASRRAEAAAKTSGRGVNMPRALALLVFVVMIRSWTQLGFTTFVPFYYLDVLKADPRIVGPLLFVFLGAGALGTVAAGPVADRWGARPFMVWIFLAVTPLAALFLNVGGILAFVVLGLVGAALVSSFTVSVVLAQQYLPRNPGMASGLIVGFALGTGGLGVTLLGWVADHWSLMTALWISALMPLAGFVGAALLPAPRPRA